MMTLSKQARSLWAKKSDDGSLSWLPLTSHLTDTAAVAQKLWNCWLSDGVRQAITAGIGKSDCAEQLVIFLAAAHDIGKATPVFQAKKSMCGDLDERIEELLLASGLPLRPHSSFPHADRTPHALATQVLLEAAGCDRNVAVILGAHHGRPPGNETLIHCGIGSYAENYHLGKEGREVWAAVQQELIDFALELSGFSSVLDLPAPNMAAQVLLSGLLIMADWIASSEEYFPYIRLEDAPETNVKARIDSAWKRLSLPPPWNSGNTWMHDDLYHERFDVEPNSMQSAVAQTLAGVRTPGILVLEAPMGSGKTEAALVAAEILADRTKRKGVFFALPTQATSNGMFPRLCMWIGRLETEEAHSIHLAHGKAEFNDEYQDLAHGIHVGEDEDDGLFVHTWFEGRKKSMLDDFVVGTIDQLLFAALKQKHLMLRHLGLANKVVIIDECHAYDAYMNRYLCRALAWLGAYRVPVVVLSATLPARRRQAVMEAYLNKKFTPKPLFDPLGAAPHKPVRPPEWTVCRSYPLITFSDGREVRQRAVQSDGPPEEIRLEFLAGGALADRLEDLLSGGGCAGVIVNTVRKAQDVARTLRKRFGKETVELFHSRFLAPDRATMEKGLLRELGKPGRDTRRPEKRIVVGTQVLEQSLDIDLDLLITDICPMDLLLQRIGRLHRHRRDRPEKLQTALCLITGLDGSGFEPDTEKIYGRYLLLRTRACLPQRLILPRDIPELVQDVYGESALLPDSAESRQAKQEQEKRIADQESRADSFRLGPPWPGPEQNIAGWLDTVVSSSDQAGEATVRDTDESIEVLVVQKKRDGRLHFLPWIEEGREISQNEIPDEKSAMTLARCSVRLPGVLCAPWAIEKTVRELEAVCREQFPIWQRSPWLKGELFLILDEKFSMPLGGYRLTYNRDDGLFYEREVNANA